MGRIGYRVNEASADEIVKISELPNIEVNGMFTHFSTADEKDKDYTLNQYKKFVQMVLSSVKEDWRYLLSMRRTARQ